jgi:hypothetical protein
MWWANDSTVAPRLGLQYCVSYHEQPPIKDTAEKQASSVNGFRKTISTCLTLTLTASNLRQMVIERQRC